MQSSGSEVKPEINGKLPRGLVNKGAKERLPSLRSDPSLSKGFLTANPPPTTRGGIAKRTFKPNISNCLKRNAAEEANHNNSESNLNNEKPTTSRRGRPPKNKHKPHEKQWIQTEGAVFKGESNPKLLSNREREETTTRKRRADSTDVRVKHEKDERNIPKIKREIDKDLDAYIGDDFVVDDHCRTNLLYPKGWHAVTRHRKVASDEPKPSLSQPLTPYNLFESESDSPEKLLLFQMPEEIVNRSEGKIGKIRVYKSGRIEFQDSETKLKFDLLFDQNSSSDCQRNIKQEDGASVCAQPTDKSSDLTEDLVSFDGTNLCAIASIEHKQVMTAVPTLPLDSQSIAKIL